MKITYDERTDNFIERYSYGSGITDLREYVVRTISACKSECSYCYLKGVYRNREIILYNNFKKLFSPSANTI